MNGAAGGGTTLFERPNQHARAPAIDLAPDRAVIHGYQEFELTKTTVRVLDSDPPLKRKRDLLAPLFRPERLLNRSILDLGANGAFFSFWGLHNGARAATALDMDEEYLALVDSARSHLGFGGLRTVNSNVMDWHERADVVLALALIHWIYSCTATLGSLDAAVGKLSALTDHVLVVEWVDPMDAAIAFFQHLEWNQESAREAYNLQNFEAALSRHFARVEFLGDVSASRKLYAAYRHSREIDRSNPLPALYAESDVIYSRRVAILDCGECWSRIYDARDVVHKQTSGDLAAREAQILGRLDSGYFPKVLGTRTGTGYSVVTLEKIAGRPLDLLSGDELRALASPVFFRDCLALLAELQLGGVTHRDIRRENILVRDNRPVLIDFGWALAQDADIAAPDGLGESGRPPDGGFCDVYSMGRVLGSMGFRAGTARDFIELMIQPDAALRLADARVLLATYDAVLTQRAECESGAPSMSEQARAAAMLFEHLLRRERRLASNAAREWSVQVSTAALRLAALTGPGETVILVDDAQIGDALLPGRRVLPFTERDGYYWGPPADDASAIVELERLRAAGAAYMVFAWPAFWWLSCYKGLVDYLGSRYSRVFEDGDLVVYALGREARGS